MFGLTTLDTVPVLPAVVLVSEVSVPGHLAVDGRGGAAVHGGGGGGGGGRAMGRVRARAGAALHVVGERAPVVAVVVLVVVGALLERDAALAALVVLPAGLRVSHGHVVLGTADRAIW